MRPRDSSDPQMLGKRISKHLERQREEVSSEVGAEATVDLVVATIIIIAEVTKEVMAAEVDMKAAMEAVADMMVATEEEAAIKAAEVAISSNISSQITRADIKEAAEEAGIKAETDSMASLPGLHHLEVRETTIMTSEVAVVAITREAEDLAPTNNGNIRNQKAMVNPNECTSL